MAKIILSENDTDETMSRLHDHIHQRINSMAFRGSHHNGGDFYMTFI